MTPAQSNGDCACELRLPGPPGRQHDSTCPRGKVPSSVKLDGVVYRPLDAFGPRVDYRAKGATPNVVVMPDGEERMRRFELQRDEDVSGVSGVGVVAEGVVFRSGVAVLMWTSEWPTSVVFHDRGMESIEAIHGHDGRTRIVYLDA